MRRETGQKGSQLAEQEDWWVCWWPKEIKDGSERKVGSPCGINWKFLFCLRLTSPILFYSKTPCCLLSECQDTKYSPISTCSVLGMEKYYLGLTLKERNRGLKVVLESTECIPIHLDNCICWKTYSTHGLNIQILRLLCFTSCHIGHSIYICWMNEFEGRNTELTSTKSLRS